MVQDTEFLPAQDIATLFYQKYEPREVLGKGASSTVRRCLLKGVLVDISFCTYTYWITTVPIY